MKQGDPGAPAPSAPDASDSPTDVAEYSPTNVQEAGVDEPDIVKTDGSRIFAIAAGKLQAVDLTGDTPRLIGSLRLGRGSPDDPVPLDGGGKDGQELLLHGNRILVISNLYLREGPNVVLREVDVSDAAAMRIVRTFTADGTYVSSRLNGATARVVIASRPRALDLSPGTSTVAATGPGTSRAAQQRLRRSQLRRSRLRDWLPSYVLRNHKTGRRVSRSLVRCKAVRRAASFSGLDTLTVLTIDLNKGLPPVDSDGLMTDAEIAYASKQSLYVATQRWLEPTMLQEGQAGGESTAIHKFDIANPESTAYRASGEVPGHLLNQFSLSEYGGFLRAASTVGDLRGGESFVTVLKENDGGRLEEVGRVGGLGRGEKIYSVRFIDDVGYVVTFRKVDPLYTIDLSNPAQPQVLGELKILGYSAYLHPIGDNLLLGVGQDTTDPATTGTAWMQGTQLSVFDISDLRNPTRLYQQTLGARGTSSNVEFDHHAFLYWPSSKLAVIPVLLYDRSASGEPWEVGQLSFAGAIGFHVDRDGGIREVGRVSHTADPSDRYPPDRFPASPIGRSLVIGDRLFTVSWRGVKASSLETLTGLAWVPFD